MNTGNTAAIAILATLVVLMIGFDFGDGHLNDHRLITAIQNRCRFASGEPGLAVAG